MPQFSVGNPKLISDLPVAVNRAPRGQMEPVFEKLGELKRGEALPLTFASRVHALSARSALRKIAKREGGFLSSAWGDDKVTLYLWIEPKEAVQDAKPASGKRRV